MGQLKNWLKYFFIFCFLQKVYRGYVDDPRNTDNAWMETVAFNFHDDNNQVLKDIKLEAGEFFC